MRWIIALLFVITTYTGQAQITLQQQESDKTVVLKAGGEVSFDMTLESPSFTASTRQVSGFVVGQKPNLLQIQWYSETKSYTLHTGMKKTEDIDYSGILNLPPNSFSIDEIQAIHYRGPRAGKWHKIGKVLTFVGLANALIVAPLISANFDTDQFNSDRYFQYAGASLALTGVGVTIALTNRHKTYPTQAAGRKKAAEPLWHL